MGVFFIIYFFVLLLLAPEILSNNKKSRSNAIFFAIFYGFFGIHRFYLGRFSGILFLLFIWTIIIPISLWILDLRDLFIISDKEFDLKYNKKILKSMENENNSSAQPITNKIPEIADENVIDVISKNYNTSISYTNHELSQNTNLPVPYWPHTYIYSYDEINCANKEQKEFYKLYRKYFLEGKLLDIKDNTNYAFILFFDLINDYYKHNDIKLLEQQFKLLGISCPRTKSYSLGTLQELLRKREDQYSIDKLELLSDPSYQYEKGFIDYDPDAYKLGKKYRNILQLNKQEEILLNKFSFQDNTFNSIEGCKIAIMKQYLHIIKCLKLILKENNTTLSKAVSIIKDEVVEEYKKDERFNWGYYDINEFQRVAEANIYETIFKSVENSVREVYNFNRKLSVSIPYRFEKINTLYNDFFGNSLKILLDKEKQQIIKPDMSTEIILNTKCVNRWKEKFKAITNNFQPSELTEFVKAMTYLEESNQKNSNNIENIFYEASKFISKYSKVISLQYYAKYIYYDLKSVKFDNKQLSKSIEKSIFSSEQQLIDFKLIIEDLVRNDNIDEALLRIEDLFTIKRKKIELDKNEIKEVEVKHENTVEILEEYLNTDEEDFKIVETNTDVSFEFTKKNNSDLKKLNLNDAQKNLIDLIKEKSFSIKQEEVEEYALKNGMLKNQLIDGINDLCSEILDGEMLIEEEDQHYIMVEDFYLEIAN